MNNKKINQNDEVQVYQTPQELLAAPDIEAVEKLRLLKEWEQELRESIEVTGKDQLYDTGPSTNLHELLKIIEALEEQIVAN